MQSDLGRSSGPTRGQPRRRQHYGGRRRVASTASCFCVADVRRLVGQATWSELLRARPQVLVDAVPEHKLAEADLGESTLPPLFGRELGRPFVEAARLRQAWGQHPVDCELWPQAREPELGPEAARLTAVATSLELTVARVERAATAEAAAQTSSQAALRGRSGERRPWRRPSSTGAPVADKGAAATISWVCQE